MDVQMVPAALRERLGAEAALGLAEVFGEARHEWVADVTEMWADRFERRLIEEVAGLRLEMVEGDAALRQEMTTGFSSVRQDVAQLRQQMTTDRFELIKWSFAFWVGQVLAVAAILGLFLHRG